MIRRTAEDVADFYPPANPCFGFLSKPRMSVRIGRGSLRSIFFFTFFCFTMTNSAFGQKVSFGVVAGANLTDDFRNATISDEAGIGGFSVSNASEVLIVGPKVDIHLSKFLSVEIDALHRKIRTHNTIRSAFCPIEQLPSCTVLVPFTHSSIGTEFSWEFPVLAKYKGFAPKGGPFLELGPSFRPAENREGYGVTAGAGMEIPFRSMQFAPTVRYTHWNYRHALYLGAVRDQIQFVVGVDRASSSESVSALGYKVSLGAVVGVGVTHDFQESILFFQGGLASVKMFSESKSPIGGAMIEFEAGRNLFVEIDALYRPLRLTSQYVTSLEVGSPSGAAQTVTVLTWEFPLLAKYKFSVARKKGFVELGPSFRAIGNLNGTNPSRYGVAGGVGIEAHLRKVKFSPALRYTRWAIDEPRGLARTLPARTNTNQVELVVGFSL